MGLVFENVRYARPGGDLEVAWNIPSGAFVGLVGPNGCGAEDVLRLAGGLAKPQAGRIACRGARLAAASLSSADPEAVRRSIAAAVEDAPAALLLGPSPALIDRAGLMGLLADLHRLQRAGTTIVFFTHDLGLLERHADEVAAFEAGKIVDRGDPRSVLGRYRERELRRGAAAARGNGMQPVERRGDGRIRVESVRLTDADGNDAAFIRSGTAATVEVRLRAAATVEVRLRAAATVEVRLRAAQEVAETVVGIMIRSRIGVTVYGTNTELEGLALGAPAPGERAVVRFVFDCALCPGEYTLTAASHEPDGTAHDWLEEALFFTVEDDRYTAGVANLRARVTVEKYRKTGTRQDIP